MPELPEVEVTRRGFAQAIQGASILRLQLGKPLRWPLGCDPATLEGLRVLAVRRRGKYLLLDLSRGILLIHLGMSGRLRFAASLPQPEQHDHMDLVTTQGVLRLHDPRRFGAVVYAPSEREGMARALLAKLGPEPLEEAFDPQTFYLALRQRSAPIKQVLLAGELVVGVGNIYASEALFRAGIKPTQRACTISRARAQALHGAIREALWAALSYGGSTLRDFADATGESGYFQQHAMVYDRAGQPCRVCGTPIRWLRQGQRSSYYCPRCQRG